MLSESPTPAEDGSDGEVQPFDLTGAGQVTNRSYPTLSILEDRTATRFALELSHALHASVEVVPESSEVCKYHVFTSRIVPGTCLNQLHLEGLGGHGLLTLDSELLYAMLERLLGGGGLSTSSSEPPPRTRFSSFEQRIIRRVVHLFGRSMEEAWRTQLPLTVKHVQVETRPENVPIVPGSDSITATTFKVIIDDTVQRMQLALPLSIIDNHRKRLSSDGLDDAKREARWRGTLRGAFDNVRVNVVAELGRARVTLGEILDLRVGEVLRLDQSPDEPVTVSVEGVPKLRGQPTVRHGNLAVILETDPRSEARKGAQRFTIHHSDDGAEIIDTVGTTISESDNPLPPDLLSGYGEDRMAS